MKPVVFGTISLIQPDFFRRFQQCVRADNIGFDKGVRAGNGSVNVGFGGEMNKGISLLFAQQTFHQVLLQDITLHKAEPLVAFDGIQTGDIARVGQSIQNHQSVGGIFPQPIVNKIRADKPRTTRYQ